MEHPFPNLSSILDLWENHGFIQDNSSLFLWITFPTPIPCEAIFSIQNWLPKTIVKWISPLGMLLSLTKKNFQDHLTASQSSSWKADEHPWDFWIFNHWCKQLGTTSIRHMTSHWQQTSLAPWMEHHRLGPSPMPYPYPNSVKEVPPDLHFGLHEAIKTTWSSSFPDTNSSALGWMGPWQLKDSRTFSFLYPQCPKLLAVSKQGIDAKRFSERLREKMSEPPALSQNTPSDQEDHWHFVCQAAAHLVVFLPFSSIDSLTWNQIYGELPNHRIAITGSDGKTSTSHFLHQLLNFSHQNNITLGTLGVLARLPTSIFHSETSPPQKKTNSDAWGWIGQNTTALTSPDQGVFGMLCPFLKKENIQHLIFEASSHALDQDRMGPLFPTISIFTNFSQDHLDYHGSLEKYWEAKVKLFRQTQQRAIFHYRLPHLNALWKTFSHLKPIVYGPRRALENMQKIVGSESKMIFTYDIQKSQGLCHWVEFSIDHIQYSTKFPLIGEFQVANFLAALSALYCMDPSQDKQWVRQGLENCQYIQGIPGRMMLAGIRNQCPIYIDYAHTEKGLLHALQTLRASFPSYEIGLVFGCGGNRDPLKRPKMGHVAQCHADWVILTDDNPRDESPAAIRQAISQACPKALEIPQRDQAIFSAISRLKENTALIIAGKGHETYQIIGPNVFPFSDSQWVRQTLQILDHHEM